MNSNRMLLEMAALHLDDNVADLIILGDINGAVEAYIKNMKDKKATIAKTSTAVTNKIREGRAPKSLKISADKLSQITNDMWTEFDNTYRERVASGVTPQKKLTKGSTLKTRSGEEVFISAGQKQKVIKDDLATKVLQLIKELENDLEDEDDIKKQDDLAGHLRALDIMIEALNYTRSGKALLKRDPDELKQRYDKISKEFKRKNVNESDTYKVGKKTYKHYTLVDYTTLMNKAIDREKDPATKQRLTKVRDMNIEAVEYMFKSIKSEESRSMFIEPMVKFANQILKRKSLTEDRKETGNKFGPSYEERVFIKLMDDIIKNAKTEEDRKKYLKLKNDTLANLATFISAAYEEGTGDIYKKMAIDMAEELRKREKTKNRNSKNESLSVGYDYKTIALMESVGYEGPNFSENYFASSFAKAYARDVNKYGEKVSDKLYERVYGEDINDLLDILKLNEEFLEEAANTKSVLLFEGYGVDQELSEGVWDTIKSLGKGVFGRLGLFLNSKFTWVKELAAKGIGFFVHTPIAKLAVPAVLIAGSVGGAYKLIQKIRKDLKQSPLSKEERENFKKEVERNKELIRNNMPTRN